MHRLLIFIGTTPKHQSMGSCLGKNHEDVATANVSRAEIIEAPTLSETPPGVSNSCNPSAADATTTTTNRIHHAPIDQQESVP
jgi:hypothetical protein